jgi:hypothetical protein
MNPTRPPCGPRQEEADMERRGGLRAACDAPVSAFVDGFRHPCRAVDLSPTGMLYERSRSLGLREPYELNAYELRLGDRRIRVRARTVWTRDRLCAVRFVVMNDVDRLTIAEHIDDVARHDARALLH